MPIYFAGLQACTLEEQAQKQEAQITGIVGLVILLVGLFFLFRLVAKSNLSSRTKTLLYVLLTFIVLPICVVIPSMVAFLMTPWCV